MSREPARPLLSRALAVLLVSALILTAPGLPFYQALAADTVEGDNAAPVANGGVDAFVSPAVQTPQVSARPSAAALSGAVRGMVLPKGASADGAAPGALDSGADGSAQDEGVLDSVAAAAPGAALVSTALQAPGAAGAGSSNGVLGDPFAGRVMRSRGASVRRSVARLAAYFKSFAGDVLVRAGVARPSGVAAGSPRDERITPSRASGATAAPVASSLSPVAADLGDPFGAHKGAWAPLGVVSGGAAQEPPPPPPANQPPARDGSFKSAAWFVASMFVAQIGIEAWGAYSSKWTMDAYGSGRYNTLSMLSMLVSLVSGYIGGAIADKLGMKRSYVVSGLLGAASAGALLILFGAVHSLPFWAFTALTLSRMLIGGVAGTVHSTLPIAIFNGDQDKLNKFNSSTQFLLEFPGIFVPLFIGNLLGWFGTLGALSLMPITGAASILLVAFFVKVNEGTAKGSDSGAQEPRKTDGKLLRLASVGYIGFVLLNYLLYSIVALSYGNFLHPGSTAAEQAASAAVSGRITGFYSAGGLIAAVFLSGALVKAWSWLRKTAWGARLEARAAATALGRWIAAKLAASKAGQASETPEQKDARGRKVIARWMRIGAFGLLGFVPFIWTSPALVAAAMIPFGATNVVGQLKLMSLAQSQTPEEKSGKVMGMISAVTSLVAIGGQFGFSALVDHGAAIAKALPFLAALHIATAAIPFALFLVFLVPLGLGYFLVARKLQNYTPPSPSQK